MSRSFTPRPFSWSQRIALSPRDRLELPRYVASERNLYNHLIGALAGPMRTMPEALAAFAGLAEDLVGEIAVRGDDVRELVKAPLPDHYVRYAGILPGFDAKALVILDIFRKSANIVPHVRRAMAIEVLRYAREHAAALSQPAPENGPVYNFALSVLSPHDERTKRHVQIPRKALLVTEGESGTTEIRVPYLHAPVNVPTPNFAWSYLVLRMDEDGGATVELSRESAGYLLRRIDPSARARTSKRARG